MSLKESIKWVWSGSIRRQLTIGFGLSALLLMLLFGYLVLDQQREALYKFSDERATSLAHALSISGTSWTLANDLVGLQEVVQGFTKTPDLRRAYFLSLRGEVLASTNPDEVGFFVTDELSRGMLASNAREQMVLGNWENLIVVAHPVIAGGRVLGWVRVEMSRDGMNANLAELTRMWFGFMLVTVAAVMVAALSLGYRLTRGLAHLTQVAIAAERGEGKLNYDVGRHDEIGVLARHLDRMQESLEKQKNIIAESEAKYRFLADNISDVIWIVNLQEKRWEYMSPSVHKMLGYTVEEIVSSPLKFTLTEQSYRDIQGWVEARVKLFLDGQGGETAYTDEVQQVRKDGSTVWIEVTTHFAHNDAGQLILLGVSRDISERKKAEEQIRNLAFYDVLTRLPNRRLLTDRFGQVVATLKRRRCYAALLFIDLDNFKPLNDEYGHDAGDLLLMDVAARISACVRKVDTVSRFGGDEFVVILSELDGELGVAKQQAEVVAEKIREELCAPYRINILREGGLETQEIVHHCSASIGAVLFNQDVRVLDDMIKIADTAMYQAKSAGRDQVCFA